MTDLVSSKTVLSVGSSVYKKLCTAYQTRQKERVESFFECVETRYESMSEEERIELNKSIDSSDGQELLANYVDAITQTSSKRVRMAIALLYCKDADFSFSAMEQQIFINGVVGITDHMIDFLVAAIEQPVIKDNGPYPRHFIDKASLLTFPVKDIDAEGVYSYTHDLIRRRLLLPDHVVGMLGDDDGWFLTYGTSAMSVKMVRLLLKAGELSR
ncbi:hypothetical protein [Aliivibrio sp. 1S128]|uniref:hypothetical protein n=1 Tax=Aliivibrio sp. 1S128 TaxID=1840085 RepID=UPI00080E226D|nr:hypothetical protein [Aliivibrio sp. 1S128]OCH23955.1 hypothetical protein A6E03_19280 [Aliivibrio sp. 1S128]